MGRLVGKGAEKLLWRRGEERAVRYREEEEVDRSMALTHESALFT
jgi:hypothetical protein